MLGVGLRRRAVLQVAAQPVRLELLDHRGQVGLGQVHLVERLHGREPRRSAFVGLTGPTGGGARHAHFPAS